MTDVRHPAAPSGSLVGEPVPVLLYHSVSADPSPWIAPYTVPEATFRRHLDLLQSSGRQAVTLSRLCEARDGVRPLPGRPVVITFDDGFADTLDTAARVLTEQGLVATVYVTTGFVGRGSPGGDVMLGADGVRALASLGHEIGAHSVTHPELDTVSPQRVAHELIASRADLEDLLGARVDSFAYPHGYSSPMIRRLVRAVGYRSACSVRNALCAPTDPDHALSRLMVMASTTDDDVRRWLDGVHRPPRPLDGIAVRGWRTYRRGRARGHRVVAGIGARQRRQPQRPRPQDPSPSGARVEPTCVAPPSGDDQWGTG
jgi:peptidoglycan/xylan/chitin deacetylase (PgdA/CDA1 family)